MKTKMNFYDRYLFAITIYYESHCATLFNLFNHINVCISISWFHIYDRTVHYCCMHPCRWLRRAETWRRITTCLYTVVANCSVVVGICMVIYLTARNMDNLKLKIPACFKKQRISISCLHTLFLRSIFYALSSNKEDWLPDVEGLGIKTRVTFGYFKSI